MVGSLMYLEQATRPDLSYAVNVASRVEDSPTQSHFALLKRIIRYLQSTITDGIKFTVVLKPIVMVTMVGAEAQTSNKWHPAQVPWGSVVWKSKLQQCAALSAVEAEYVAASSHQFLFYKLITQVLSNLFMDPSFINDQNT
ncbi:uncharacterized protein LOC126426570 [Schistocerca serialis cubense]|uniref:uncharacterized protein LOC126426570 n=1 Tax=Schistocerca serialis cubense TaxID=2023355 RepID=UPI00214E9E14|nr:uncharacterized protein LOC126426570 [Schistocerca serialis cubense]